MFQSTALNLPSILVSENDVNSTSISKTPTKSTTTSKRGNSATRRSARKRKRTEMTNGLALQTIEPNSVFVKSPTATTTKSKLQHLQQKKKLSTKLTPATLSSLNKPKQSITRKYQKVKKGDITSSKAITSAHSVKPKKNLHPQQHHELSIATTNTLQNDLFNQEIGFQLDQILEQTGNNNVLLKKKAVSTTKNNGKIKKESIDTTKIKATAEEEVVGVEVGSAVERNEAATEVLPGLFVGSKLVAKDKYWFIDNHCFNVLNVTKEIKNYFENKKTIIHHSTTTTADDNIIDNDDNISKSNNSDNMHSKEDAQKVVVCDYKRISVSDSSETNIKQYFDEAVNYIHNSITTNGSVLVHCNQGRSRSVTMIAAYLIYRGMWLNRVYNFLENTVPNMNINDGFKIQLMNYEKEIRRTKKPSADFFSLPKRRRNTPNKYSPDHYTSTPPKRSSTTTKTTSSRTTTTTTAASNNKLKSKSRGSNNPNNIKTPTRKLNMLSIASSTANKNKLLSPSLHSMR